VNIEKKTSACCTVCNIPILICNFKERINTPSPSSKFVQALQYCSFYVRTVHPKYKALFGNTMKGGSISKLEINPNTVNFLKPVKFTYNNKNKIITK